MECCSKLFHDNKTSNTGVRKLEDKSDQYLSRIAPAPGADEGNDFLLVEVETAIENLKKKTPGADGLTGEVIKAGRSSRQGKLLAEKSAVFIKQWHCLLVQSAYDGSSGITKITSRCII